MSLGVCVCVRTIEIAEFTERWDLALIINCLSYVTVVDEKHYIMMVISQKMMPECSMF